VVVLVGGGQRHMPMRVRFATQGAVKADQLSVAHLGNRQVESHPTLAQADHAVR
jgi:hypothetical protein